MERGLNRDEVGTRRGQDAEQRYRESIETLKRKIAQLEREVAAAEANDDGANNNNNDEARLRELVLGQTRAHGIRKTVQTGSLGAVMHVGGSSEVMWEEDDEESDGEDEIAGFGNKNMTMQELGDLVKVAGVVFEQTQNALLAPDADRDGLRLRRYQLGGTSHGLAFGLEFDVNEKELVVERVALDLPSVYEAELAALKTRVESSRSLRFFFKTFVSFAKLVAVRTALFRTLKIEFGSWVVLPHGAANAAILQANDPEEDSSLPFHFSFVWEIATSGKGSVVQNMEIFPSFSLSLVQADAADSYKLVTELSSRFRSLIAWGGITSALRIMIRLVQSGRAPAPANDSDDDEAATQRSA